MNHDIYIKEKKKKEKCYLIFYKFNIKLKGSLFDKFPKVFFNGCLLDDKNI